MKSDTICTSALVPMRGALWAEEPASAPGGKPQWSTCCPAHDDRSPSLIIYEGRTGACAGLLMTGCEPIAIISQIRWHEVADRLSMTPPPPASGHWIAQTKEGSGRRVAAVLACIAERFPQAFVPEKYLPHRPLKVGIHII